MSRMDGVPRRHGSPIARQPKGLPSHRRTRPGGIISTAQIQYRPNACSSCRQASLKSRSGSTCRSIQFARISFIVMFGEIFIDNDPNDRVGGAHNF
jgi:hypothetical protein